MALRLSEIVVDSHDPRAQALWWAEVLGYHVTWEDERQVEIGPWEREPEDLAAQLRRAPTVPTIAFVPVPEGNFAEPRTDRGRHVGLYRRARGRGRTTRPAVRPQPLPGLASTPTSSAPARPEPERARRRPN